MRPLLAAAFAVFTVTSAAAADEREMELLYPRQALQSSVGGLVLVDCTVLEEGALDCRVVDENPARHGFGDAVLLMSESWRMATVDESGASTIGRRVRRSIQFDPGPPPSVRELRDGGRVDNPYWVEIPTANDFALHYPREALRRGLDGAVMLECVVNTDYSLTCEVDQETPEGFGFGRAAVRISEAFRMAPATRDGVSTAGGRVRVPIRFNAQ